MRLIIVAVLILTINADSFAQLGDAGDDAVSQRLTARLVQADLDRFQQILNEHWLVSNLNDADFDAVIEQTRIQFNDGATVGELAVELERILSLGADGHAATEFSSQEMRRQCRSFPPFTILPVGDRYVAIKPLSHRVRQLFRPQFPYVVAIDAVPIEKWIEEAMPFVSQSHSLAMRAGAADEIRFAGFFRNRLGIPDVGQYALELESVDGTRRVETFDATDVPPTNGSHYLMYRTAIDRQKSGLPSREFSRLDHGYWRITDENVGYIRLEKTSGDSGRKRLAAMAFMKDTDGLVLDLRGNLGGNTWDPLSAWGLFFLPPQTVRHSPFIVRRWKWHDRSDFAPSYRQLSPELSPAGRKFVHNTLGQLQSKVPKHTHRPTEDWACLTARPVDEPMINSFHRVEDQLREFAFYHYDRPVIVLCDRYTFSAGEILAAGLQSFPNVRVLGEPTTGGGGSPVDFTLPSGQGIRIAGINMILKSDGTPIDGVGVIPDIPVTLDIDTLAGKRDTMMDHAVDQIQMSRKFTDD